MARPRASNAIIYRCARTLSTIALCSSCASTNQSKIIEPTRLSGKVDIQPSAADLELLAKSGKSRAVTVAKMCLDEAGNVNSVEFLKKSGLREWNTRILEEMREWKHTPFVEGGQPIATCQSVTFIYKPNDAR